MTDTFINNLISIRPDKLTDKVFFSASRCFIDYLACTLAGAKSSHPNVVSPFDLHCQSSMPIAALFSGMNSHAVELDDGHRKGAVHVGGTVFSALQSVAQHVRISSRDFLFGAVIGYEATIRLACAIQPGNKLRGYHATGTCGTVGSALGIAAALHYTAAQMKATLSAAVTSAAGVLEMQEDDSDLKPYNVGRAAMDAVAAAFIGRSGMHGPKDALGGKRGFLKVMTDTPHPEFLTDFNGDTLCVEQIYQKPYAACRHAHPVIEAALELRKDIDLARIEKIEVRAYRLAVAGHDHTQIQGISSAKMSIPFGVAVALATGSAGLASYSEATVSNGTILSLTKKVIVLEDEELTRLCPEKRASILTIQMSNGTKLTKRVDYPKGEPENPLSQTELEAKFRELAMFGGLTKEACDMVLCEIWKKDWRMGTTRHRPSWRSHLPHSCQSCRSRSHFQQ